MLKTIARRTCTKIIERTSILRVFSLQSTPSSSGTIKDKVSIHSQGLLFARKKKQEDQEDKDVQPDKEPKDGQFLSFQQLLKEFRDPENYSGNTKYYLLGALAFLVLTGLFLREKLHLYQKITTSELIDALESKQINSVTLYTTQEDKSQSYATILFHNGSKRSLEIFNVDSFVEKLELWQKTSGASNGMVALYHVDRPSNNTFVQKSIAIASSALMIVVAGWMLYNLRTSTIINQSMQGGSGKKVSEYILEKKVKTTFKDVAGLGQPKLEIMEFVEFLKTPQKYQKLGAKIPKGALLSGPPGTGKTLLAKACAGEAGVTFLSLSGSDFVELFVGVGASKVRKLFEEAKKHQPSIIFIDEIDAIGKKRDSSGNSGSSERDSTLNQLLVELDGFGTDSEIVVFAATNRKEILDDALVRTGRFDRSIEISLPDIDSRKEIFNVHLEPLTLSDSKTIHEYANRLATLTPGFSASDIASICNEAAIQAARNNRHSVTPHDFEMAVERVIGGLEKKRIVTDYERKTVAVHESGHAVVSWFLEGGDPLLKLTIIPRSKGSLGFAQYLPNESSLDTKEQLKDKISKVLGGRVAEEEFFGVITTGAYDDLNKAYQMARNMVIKLGMSERLGYVNYQEDDNGMKTYSDETNTVRITHPIIYLTCIDY